MIPQDQAFAYRKLPNKPKPAPGEMRSLRHEFEAWAAFNELQAEQPLSGFEAKRRWAVIKALYHGTDIPFSYGETQR